MEQQLGTRRAMQGNMRWPHATLPSALTRGLQSERQATKGAARVETLKLQGSRSTQAAAGLSFCGAGGLVAVTKLGRVRVLTSAAASSLRGSPLPSVTRRQRGTNINEAWHKFLNQRLNLLGA